MEPTIMKNRDGFDETLLQDLISLDSSDDSERNEGLSQIHQGKRFQTEAEFQKQINKLKAASTLKFRNKWEQILHKYSHIDDDVESDEIDLGSGKITVDNGHLKSLSHIRNKNVWAPDFDDVRDRLMERRREKLVHQKKTKMKEQLKAQDMFFLDSSDSRHVSPVRRVSPDNILLLDPSPTKKQRISPIKGDNASLVDEESPSKRVKNPDDKLSNLPEPTIETSTPVKFNIDDGLLDGIDLDNEEESDVDLNPFIDNTMSILTSKRDFVSKIKGSLPTQKKKPGSISNIIASDDEDSEEEYLIVNAPEMYIPTNGSLICLCPFHKCHYTTGNRMIFERHLLDKHRNELYIIGYPILSDEVSKSAAPIITNEMIEDLNKVFPLVHNVPPLPLSSNEQMFKCRLLMVEGTRFCKREFLTIDKLNNHQDNYPFQCSYKTQVYVCPVLGCGFMTDEGYIHWRKHFLEMSHHKKTQPRGQILEELVKESLFSDKSKSRRSSSEAEPLPLLNTHKTAKNSAILKELDDLFNDD